MPREGYKTVCVTEEVYNYIQKKAIETNCSIPEYIKRLIEKEKPAKKKVEFCSVKEIFMAHLHAQLKKLA
jgi:hypothetical protein